MLTGVGGILMGKTSNLASCGTSMFWAYKYQF